MLQWGYISSLEGNTARVTVPERDDYVTAPFTIAPAALLQYDGSFGTLLPGDGVAFVEFTGTRGIILARLEV